MPDWTAFAAVAGFVLFLVLALAWITSGAFGSGRRSSEAESLRPEHDRTDGETPAVPDRESDPPDAVASPSDHEAIPTSGIGDVDGPGGADDSSSGDSSGAEPPSVESIPTTALLANVLLTHGGLGLLLLGAVALTGIPADALGVENSAWSTGTLAIGGGLALGGLLATANVTLAASLDRVGVEHSEDLQAALAPESRLGWALLFVVILPLVAAFEELLFRGVLIGAAAAATGISPWPFVVCSSVAFALGHGMQGKSGIAVTGLLGGVLGVAFMLTNSLLLVAVAHYVVNAVEFLLKEWLGWEFGE